MLYSLHLLIPKLKEDRRVQFHTIRVHKILYAILFLLPFSFFSFSFPCPLLYKASTEVPSRNVVVFSFESPHVYMVLLPFFFFFIGVDESYVTVEESAGVWSPLFRDGGRRACRN